MALLILDAKNIEQLAKAQQEFDQAMAEARRLEPVTAEAIREQLSAWRRAYESGIELARLSDDKKKARKFSRELVPVIAAQQRASQS